jgi:hypothetical protein
MSEKYEILESIDSTLLGNLSRAYNPDSEKEVLFLQIYNHIRDDKKALEDVWRQMNVYNELKHPVLPTVLDAKITRSYCYRISGKRKSCTFY